MLLNSCYSSHSKLPKTYCADWHWKDKVEKIRYKQLGTTDLFVSQVGIGGCVAGGIYPDKITLQGTKESFITAIKSGLNFIDTSPYYGEGRSESVIGEILLEVPRKSYYLATKVGRYKTDMKTGFDFSRERILAEFEKSLERLGVKYVDLIQVHDFEFCKDPLQITKESLLALQEIRNSGRARYIGITGYPLEEFHAVLDNTTIKIDTVLSYSRNILTDMSLKDHLSYFLSKDLGVINASPTGMGLLTNAGPPDWHPARQNIKSMARGAADYCKTMGVELGKLSVHHNLECSDICTTLLGFGSMSILNINLDIVFNGLSENELEVYHHVKNVIFKGVQENWEGEEHKNI